MGVQLLRVKPDGMLRASAKPVEAFTAAVRALARDLTDTMYANDGIGIAAPQIGCALQLFVASPSQRRGAELVVANPVLDHAEGRTTMVEGCLSVPKVWERVRRSASVRVSGQDLFGRPLVIEATGLLAVVLQHECDHLQGRLFIDRLPCWRRMMRTLEETIVRRRGCA